MRLRHAGAPFRALHDAFVGSPPDLTGLAREDIAPELRARAIAVWGYRVQTEFRSMQVMSRFVTEVLASGDPVEVAAGAIDALRDELRHTALCAAVVEALGGVPELPELLEERERPEFLALPMPARALGTAVSRVLVSETLSVGFITDLHARCTQPELRAVLAATLADEDTHDAFGVEYVRASLARFDDDGRTFAKMVVETTLAPHVTASARSLSNVSPERRTLAAWPEPELAHLGLLGPEREALVFEATKTTVLLPRLRALGLD